MEIPNDYIAYHIILVDWYNHKLLIPSKNHLYNNDGDPG